MAAKKSLRTLKKGESRTALEKQAKDAFSAAKVIADSFGMSHKSRVAQAIKMTGSGGDGGANIGNESKKAQWHQKASSRS